MGLGEWLGRGAGGLAPPFFLPSLEGRGWGWVALRIVGRQTLVMSRVSPEMTRRARALRSNATDAERRVWLRIRSYRPRFTRQLVVGRYIIDMACREAKLAIELDGGQHADSPYDEERTAHLESLGWTVLRFWNSDVIANPDGVAEAILAEVGRRLGPTHPQPLPSREGRKKGGVSVV